MEFIDLKRQYKRMREEIDETIKKVLSSCRFILGPEVEALEKELSEFVGVKFCVSTSSGTDALLLSLMCLGIREGDEVIVPAFTFFATAEVVALLGAKPVFVDVDYKTFNVTSDAIKRAITDKTKAIIVVSLYGQCPDFDSIMSLAKAHKIPVIEDAAQSFGAEYKGRKSCSIADLSITSFFPAKPLGAYGDGGAVFTNDEFFYHKLLALRNHGQVGRYRHKYIGINGRLDALQAAILRVKLKYFPQEVELRQIAAGRYDALLKEAKIEPPYVEPYNLSVYAQYTIKIENRDGVSAFLNKNGIPTAIHYPLPLPYQEAFANLGYKWGDFPVSERLSKEVLSLPFHPYITIEEQIKVVEALKEAISV